MKLWVVAAMVMVIHHHLMILAGATLSGSRVLEKSLEERAEDAARTSRKVFESRIVGGTAASPNEFPFFVHWKRCGASLIHPDIVLSAAHCNVVSSNTVYVGAYEAESTAYGAQVRTITARRLHPNYNHYTTGYDFLVMKLNSPVTTVTPISLNSDPGIPANNETLTVIGFGTTSEGGSSSSILRKVNVNYVDTASCNIAYKGQVIDSLMFCAGVSGGGKDSCQGDSGGPIFTSQGAQVGIVSWGTGCARSGYPGINSRISTAIDWINQQVCALSANPPLRCTAPSVSPVPPPTLAPIQPTLAPVPAAIGTQMVFLELYYDRHPNEASWVLFDNNQQVVASSPSGAGAPETWINTRVFLVPGATYTWKLSDSRGDGFCCRFGSGYFIVRSVLNGNGLILSQGYAKFQYELSVTFVVSSGPAPIQSTNKPIPTQQPRQRPTRRPTSQPTKRPTKQPTQAPAASSYTVVALDLLYDKYPSETTWILLNSNLQAVAVSPHGAGVSETWLRRTFWLTPGASYTWVLFDSSSDGMCCQYGTGYYYVRAITDGYSYTLKEGYGVFDDEMDIYFTVPLSLPRTLDLPPATLTALPSRKPASPPPAQRFVSSTLPGQNQCVDDAKNKFTYSKGHRSCRWLASKPLWRTKLCVPGEKAFDLCWKTCNRCN